MDSKRILILFFLNSFLLFFGQTNASLEVSSGNLISFENFPSNYVRERTVYVWLPEDYKETEKYQILYLNDGQMLFDSSTTWNHQEWQVDEIMSDLTENKKIPPTIVVGISNIPEIRHSEYFPQKPFESLDSLQKESIYAANRNLNSPLFKEEIQSDNYLKFLVEELIPFIDSQFSTYQDAQHRFIGGSSMGGLISMYALCKYPEVFGGAICMSTHWPGIFEMADNPIPAAFENYLDENLPSLENHKIYFDYGNQTLDAMYGPYQQEIDNIMSDKPNSDKSWKTLFFEGAAHSEKSWAARLNIPLEFILNP